MPELNELLSVDFWHEHLLAVSYVGAGLLLFIVFVIAGFPYDRALTGTLAPMGLQLSYSDQHLRFPIGSVLENVTLLDMHQPGGEPVFQSDRVALAPGLGTLIGRPGIHVDADAYDGQARVTLQQSGNLSTIGFDLKEVDLSRYPLPTRYGVSVRGIVSAKGNLRVDDVTKISQDGAMTLLIRELAVGMGRALPRISFSRLDAELTIRHGVVTVDRLEGSGPDAALSVHGTVHLGPTAQLTTVDLSARITPTAIGRARLGFLLGFLPHPPDSRPYVIRGSLAAPALS
jgi:type II secretion system protein N